MQNINPTPSAQNATRPSYPDGRWYFAIWTLLALISASEKYLTHFSEGTAITIGEALSYGLVSWYTFAALSLPVIWLARKIPLAGMGVVRGIGIFLLTSIAFSLAHTTITHGLWYERYGPDFLFSRSYFLHLLFHYQMDLLVFAGVVAIYYLQQFYRRAREREVRESQLETQLTRAQLQVLKTQIQPHFLFNTLNNIAALMYDQPDRAYDMLTRLSGLLRVSLEQSDRQEVRLEEELALLDDYIAIQQTRFPDRLSVIREIAAETLALRVPGFILQPLVENAIRHGIAPFAFKGVITISAAVAAGTLQICIRDNGPGISGNFEDAFSRGKGLSNCRQRLAQLYGENQQLELRNEPGGGFTVCLHLPAVPLKKD